MAVKEEEADGDTLRIQFDGENGEKFARALLRQNKAFILSYVQRVGITETTDTKPLIVERILSFLSTAPGTEGNPLTEETINHVQYALIPITSLMN
jgi:hypothetical protein